MRYYASSLGCTKGGSQADPAMALLSNANDFPLSQTQESLALVSRPRITHTHGVPGGTVQGRSWKVGGGPGRGREGSGRGCQ